MLVRDTTTTNNYPLPRLNQKLLQHLRDDTLIDLSLIGDDGIPVPAFRLVIACASPVFEKMLYGGFVEARRDSIKFPHASQRVLQALVHFCITGSVQLEDSDEIHHDLIQLGTLAHVYEIAGLLDPVQRIFREQLHRNPGVVCPVLVEMHEGACPELYQTALDIVRKAPHAVLIKRPQSPGITCLPPDIFQELLEKNQLQEVFLEFPRFSFQRIVEWHYCRDYVDANVLCRTVLKRLNLLALVPKDLEIMVEKASSFLTQDQIRAMLLEQETIGTVTSECRFGKGFQCSLIKIDNAELRNVNTYYKRISNNHYVENVVGEGAGEICRVFYCHEAKQWQICEGNNLRFYYPPETTRTYPWLQVPEGDDASGNVSNLQVRCTCQRVPSPDRW